MPAQMAPLFARDVVATNGDEALPAWGRPGTEASGKPGTEAADGTIPLCSCDARQTSSFTGVRPDGGLQIDTEPRAVRSVLQLGSSDAVEVAAAV